MSTDRPHGSKVYSFICSRNEQHNYVAKNLFTTLRKWDIEVVNLIGKSSFFEGYHWGMKNVPFLPHDKIILCHDDINILSNRNKFFQGLSKLDDPTVGFIGVAGTDKLDSNAVWWNWQDPSHMHGHVFHKNAEGVIYPTTFGKDGQVVVLDGVFLACTGRTLVEISLTKPETFTGGWDFYDLYFTLQAHLLGKKNFTVSNDITLVHMSGGDINGKIPWNENREAFMKMYQLPVSVK